MGLFSIFGLMFYNAQQAYLVACKRCQFYQVKYELEGLLYYGVRQVVHNKKKREKQAAREQASSKKTEFETSKKLPEWCTIGATVYAGFIQTASVEKEKYTVAAELRSLDLNCSEPSNKASCLVVCNGNSYEIINFTIT